MRTGLEKKSEGGIGSAGASSPVVQASSTWFVFLAAVFAAVGGLLFGYDTAAISGACGAADTQALNLMQGCGL